MSFLPCVARDLGPPDERHGLCPGSWGVTPNPLSFGGVEGVCGVFGGLRGATEDMDRVLEVESSLSPGYLMKTQETLRPGTPASTLGWQGRVLPHADSRRGRVPGDQRAPVRAPPGSAPCSHSGWLRLASFSCNKTMIISIASPEFRALLENS